MTLESEWDMLLGAALPLARVGFSMSTKALGMAWHSSGGRASEATAALPLDVRNADAVVEKAGDLQAQRPFPGWGNQF